MTSESTAPRPSDFVRLLLLVLLALGLRIFTVANTTVPSRDCIVFIRDGLQLERPGLEPYRVQYIDGKEQKTIFANRVEVIRGAEHPPGYSAAIIVASWIVRPLMGATEPTVASMAMSAQVVSAVSAVLLVFPLFFLTRRVFDRNVAFAAVAIFQVLPVFVEVTSDGISDGLFLLTVTWALWFAIRAVEQERTRRAFLFGLGAGVFCGLGYWLRPEALVVALASGLTFAGMMCHRFRGNTWRQPFVAGLALVVGTFGVMSPYCIMIGGLTNKKTAGGVLDVIQGREPDPSYHQRDDSRRPGVSLPLAAWWDPKTDADQWKPGWAARAVFSEYLKAAHYVVPGFALIGLLALRRRVAESRIALLLAVVAVHVSVLWLIAWKMNYVSQRHTLLTVMITCIFAGVSLPIIGTWLIRRWPTTWMQKWSPWQIGAVLTLAILAAALPRDFKSLHYERAGHKAAGRWIAEQGDKDIPVVDPFGWAGWYAERTLWTWPNPEPKADRDLYLIFEPNAKSPHSRLNHYVFIRDLYTQPSCEMIYQYPPNVPPEQSKVAVYLHHHPRSKK